MSCLGKQSDSTMDKQWNYKTVLQNCHNKILTSASLAPRISVHDTLARVHKALKFRSATFICFRETDAPLCNWHTTLHKTEQSDHYFNKYKILIYNSTLLHRHAIHATVFACLEFYYVIQQWEPKKRYKFFKISVIRNLKKPPLSNMSTTMEIF